MKNSTLILFCTLSLIACKQQTTIDFNVTFKPNSVYVIQSINTSKTEVEYLKSDDGINGNEIENKNIIESSSKNTSMLLTKSLNPDQSFSWIMTYDSLTYTKSINDISLPSPIFELTAKGTYNKNKVFHIDSLISNSLDEKLRAELTSSLSKFNDQFSMPTSKMKIGDEIIQNIPFESPFSPSTTIKAQMNIKYQLESIKDNFASFNVSYSIDSLITDENNNEMKGQATGHCEYDIKNNYCSKYQLTSNTNFTTKMNGQKIKGKIESSFSQEIQKIK